MFTVNPITFIPVTAQTLVVAPKKSCGCSCSGNRRDRCRTELRAAMGGNLKQRSGDPDARMRYTVDGYAVIVKKHCLKLVGWLSDIPFTHFSDILGGIEPIKRLHTAWRKHELYFERATPEDIANAERDPLSVHPNPR
ncbi:hypothetical protein TRAPUB_3334 [Trametes pubescens]|uniref:Uncharacterized protein n=1 Tax=Trametes pubescens TaxID=154538 RepID=A0A1M2VE51_TRAPU|nr:hypothetical protein TRAPUB_3334 [Trametes pubescens]